jgi:hypothetical protein
LPDTLGGSAPGPTSESTRNAPIARLARRIERLRGRPQAHPTIRVFTRRARTGLGQHSASEGRPDRTPGVVGSARRRLARSRARPRHLAEAEARSASARVEASTDQLAPPEPRRLSARGANGTYVARGRHADGRGPSSGIDRHHVPSRRDAHGRGTPIAARPGTPTPASRASGTNRACRRRPERQAIPQAPSPRHRPRCCHPRFNPSDGLLRHAPPLRQTETRSHRGVREGERPRK